MIMDHTFKDSGNHPIIKSEEEEKKPASDVDKWHKEETPKKDTLWNESTRDNQVQ